MAAGEFPLLLAEGNREMRLDNPGRTYGRNERVSKRLEIARGFASVNWWVEAQSRFGTFVLE
ncbi:uncharacterized protein N7483_009904 [Penicillium malachiteum]|uniref:uncharacterized protein n=1 Tax=Penicillium malachiteum TaxID=1324776 RepID=UPI002548BE4B|nr:uncharacterized protein N7483_009904 [Penicillium malachiteum]KAJ5718822.1 hypothetical protein N7483_009904 [Penicillium malachiteum]